VFDSGDPLLDASVDGELDLHGRTAMDAGSKLRMFLQTWQRRKRGAVVQIITGKGNGGAVVD